MADVEQASEAGSSEGGVEPEETTKDGSAEQNK